MSLNNEISNSQLIDLYWKASGDDWAIPDWLMVKFGRAVLSAVEEIVS